MTAANLDSYSVLPLFRRARDYHLYDNKGRRYLDLYRGDGNALFGYSVPGIRQTQRDICAAASFSGLEHNLHRQLGAALRDLFPEHLMFASDAAATIFSQLELLGLSVSTAEKILPFQRETLPDKFYFEIPGCGAPAAHIVGVAKTMRADFSASQNPEVTAGIGHTDNQEKIELVQKYLRSRQSPVTAGTALRVLELFRAFEAIPMSAPPVATRRKKDLQAALGTWSREYWKSIPCGKWVRSGPYLRHGLGPAQYRVVFKKALDQGIILHPECAGLSTLPGFMSEGEKKLLASFLTNSIPVTDAG